MGHTPNPTRARRSPARSEGHPDPEQHTGSPHTGPCCTGREPTTRDSDVQTCDADGLVQIQTTGQTRRHRLPAPGGLSPQSDAMRMRPSSPLPGGWGRAPRPGHKQSVTSVPPFLLLSLAGTQLSSQLPDWDIDASTCRPFPVHITKHLCEFLTLLYRRQGNTECMSPKL